jgi:hypothetical protein
MNILGAISNSPLSVANGVIMEVSFFLLFWTVNNEKYYTFAPRNLKIENIPSMKQLTITLYTSFCTLFTGYIAFTKQIYRMFSWLGENAGFVSYAYFEPYTMKQREKQKMRGQILRADNNGLINEYSN